MEVPPTSRFYLLQRGFFAAIPCLAKFATNCVPPLFSLTQIIARAVFPTPPLPLFSPLYTPKGFLTAFPGSRRSLSEGQFAAFFLLFQWLAVRHRPLTAVAPCRLKTPFLKSSWPHLPCDLRRPAPSGKTPPSDDFFFPSIFPLMLI